MEKFGGIVRYRSTSKGDERMLAGTVTSTDREAAGGALTDDATRKF